MRLWSSSETAWNSDEQWSFMCIIKLQVYSCEIIPAYQFWKFCTIIGSQTYKKYCIKKNSKHANHFTTDEIDNASTSAITCTTSYLSNCLLHMDHNHGTLSFWSTLRETACMAVGFRQSQLQQNISKLICNFIICVNRETKI